MLYHHTSLQGLMGIINSKSIWASNSDYLNDHSEYSHLFNLVSDYINKNYFDDDYLSPYSFSVQMNRPKYGNKNPQVFIGSFSESSDLLSQWRGYCPESGGICIGFNRESLERMVKASGYELKKCIYLEEEQNKIVAEVVEKSILEFPKLVEDRSVYVKLPDREQWQKANELNEYVSKGEGKVQADKVVSELYTSISGLAPLIKHTSFKEEVEWRIICKNPNTKTMFREANTYLVPYIALDIEPDFISEIIIGPNANSERCLKSVKDFLMLNGFENINYKISEIPLNSW
ncbi:DUF2971 domain-containing protein [bacterium]|nr:DUF2971 domain-containing protein [bacterium]MBU1434898.1 DUF2971 domain-containing protein [bacterium]MBU1504003.1 DUF2971 domain-containing protein [bacterium]